jgi:hypothetical protein
VTDSNDRVELDPVRVSKSMRILATVTTIIFTVSSSAAPHMARGTFGPFAGMAAGTTQVQVPSTPPAESLITYLERMNERLKRSRVTLTEMEGDRAALRTLRAELRAERAKALAELDAGDEHVRTHALPASIVERQRAARAQLEAAEASLEADFTAIDRAASAGALREQVTRMRGKTELLRTGRRHQEFDPSAMPFGRAKENRQAPRVQKADFAAMAPPPVPTPLLAAANPLPFAALAAPTAGELLGTEEAVLSPEVRALAAQLGGDPRNIYEWVYHNIRYVPSYGSIQGSDGALRTKSGNAIDTASLLIALLRASGIPARYVFGTVEIPIDKVKNWVGGVDSPNAALDLLAQGNVPVLGLAQGGHIKFARIEHAWVEAYVDFTPSRGAKNVEPDAWVPMDGSFKQYVYSDGVDALNALPTQPLPALTQIQQGLQTDVASGRVSGFQIEQIRTLYGEAEAAAEQLFAPGDDSSPDRLRTAQVDMRLMPVLPAGLPYKVVASSPGMAVVPAQSRRAFSVSLFRSVAEREGGTPALTLTRNLSQLSGKQLSIRFAPATPDDAAALQSYLPAPGPDGTIHPSTLRRSIPGYLIRLNAIATIDGVEVASASGFTLGQEVATRLSIQKLSGAWYRADNVNTAGEFLAISLDLQGTGTDPLYKTDAQTPENLLHQAGRAYWANLDEHLNALAAIRAAIGVRQPSFGVFSTVFQPTYRYGIPTNVKLAGVSVDVDASFTSMMAFNGAQARTTEFVEQHGAIASALEHEVPEAYLADPDEPVQGVSALSAIALAVAQNQPIFQITEDNFSLVRSQLAQSPDVIRDIQNAVAAGQSVLISQGTVQLEEWAGTGYMIIDPQTGSGAYRISGGQNGGAMNSQVMLGLGMLGLGAVGAFFIPVVTADGPDGCGEDENLRRQVQMDWKLLLTLALIMLLILALIAASGGSLGPAAAAAIAAVLRVLAPLAGYVGRGAIRASAIGAAPGVMADEPGGCYRFYVGDHFFSVLTPESQAHVGSALGAQRPSTLTYLGRGYGHDRGWMRRSDVPECTESKRAQFRLSRGLAPECDEYPFASTWEGGWINYQAKGVSLLLIPGTDNNGAGRALGQFFLKCNVNKNERFKVIINPGGAFRGEKSNGEGCFTPGLSN